MSMKINRPTSYSAQAGFSVLELVVAVAILTIVLTAVFNGVNVVVQRSQAEQTKIDMVQEGRDFIDEFERDLHQAGYPNCRMVATVVAGTTYTCPADYSNPLPAMNHLVAAGLVSVSNTQVVFEGAVDGGGTVYSVWYRVVDQAGNYPPSGTCPCRIQRSQYQVGKDPTDLTMPLAQTTVFSRELENVVNSGVPGNDAGGNPLPYGNGLNISGNTAWGQTDTAYYAAISSFKDYPVFQAYDQFGNLVPLPQDLTTSTGSGKLNCAASATDCVKTIRITVNLLSNQVTGVDLKTKIRPVVTLVGDARLVNNY
jgi:prepilin-type N-terminal cleavage/methylation domain-containing protein